MLTLEDVYLVVSRIMAEIDFRKRKKTDNVNPVGILSSENAQVAARFGPLPSFPNQRVWVRAILVLCVGIIVYFSSRKNKETIFAAQKFKYEKRVLNFECSESYKFELSKFKDCMPEICGRIVSDTLISEKEVDILLNMAKRGIALGGSEGGASVLDLHSGALSHGQNFVNFYKLPEALNVFKPEDYLTYIMVKNKIQEAVAQHFGIKTKLLYLTHPSFFSKLTSAPPRTIHDEYWHKHVDKETYESFHYTSLLYLSDYKKDFLGGRFVFINADNSTTVVEPKKGRVSIFTSGAENPHYVEKVSSGSRFAVTVSFTCDASRAVADFKPMPPRSIFSCKKNGLCCAKVCYSNVVPSSIVTPQNPTSFPKSEETELA